MLLCTLHLRELLQVAPLEIDRISGLEFALIYGRISSNCCVLKIWNLAAKACNFSYEY